MNKFFISVLATFVLLTNNIHAEQDKLLAEFKSEQAIYLKLSETNKWQEALPHAKNSYDLGIELFGKEHKNVAALADNYGLNLIRLKKYPEAKVVLTHVLSIKEKIHGSNSEELIPILMDMGHATEEGNEKPSKLNLYRKALDISKQVYAEDSLEHGNLMVEVGSNLLYVANDQRGKRYLYDGYAILAEHLEADDPVLGYASFNIAKYEFAKKRYNKAIAYFNKTLQSYEIPDRPSNKIELITHSLLVRAYEEVNQREAATRHCLAIGRMTPFSDVQEYVPLMKIAPIYPAAAADAGSQGYVTVEYDVDESGFVINPKVIDKKGHRSFEKTSIDAAKKFRYAPQFVDGKPVVTKGVQNRFKYELHY